MLSLREFMQLDVRKLAPSPSVICVVCTKPVGGGEPHFIGDDLVHEDCYYEELGKLVEQHPPGNPRHARPIAAP